MDLFHRLLDRYLKAGTLTLVNPEGEREQFGRGDPRVTLRINDTNWPRRLLWQPALAVGEGYMDGAYTIEQGGLQSLLELALRNKPWGRDPWVLRIPALVERLGKRHYELNRPRRSRSNVAHHYELSVDFSIPSWIASDSIPVPIFAPSRTTWRQRNSRN